MSEYEKAVEALEQAKKENQIIKQSFRLEETVMIAGMVAGIRL